MRFPNNVFKAEQVAGLSWTTEVTFNRDGRCYARVEVENCGQGWFKAAKVRKGSVTVWLFDVQNQLLMSRSSDNCVVAFLHRKVVPWHFNVPVTQLERAEKVAIVHGTDCAGLDEITADEALKRAQLVQ